MGYEYSDPKRAEDPHALPNVEVWLAPIGECQACGAQASYEGGGAIGAVACEACGSDEYGSTGFSGWFYAFGFPGCLYDSEPSGPYDSREQALEAAREGLDNEA